MKTQKEKVAELLKSIETGATEPVNYINPEKYIQHNLLVEDGIQGFGAVLSGLKDYPDEARVNTVRIIEDGDYVIAHTQYNFFGDKTGFDIFRFEDGLIVEHWDNLQENPVAPNPSGRSMTDGEVDIKNLGQTAKNKQIIAEFVKDILLNENPDNFEPYFNKGKLIEHNPTIGDGVENMQRAIFLREEDDIEITYTKCHRIFGEGNFVLAICEGSYGSNGGVDTSFYDLYRLYCGKIVEHWDVTETLAEKSEWKNSNGKFNFPK